MYKSAIVGFSYLTGLICASLFGIGAGVVIGLCAVLAGFVLLYIKHGNAALSLISAGAGFIVMSAFVYVNYLPASGANGVELEITGKFLEKSYNANDTGCYIIEATVNGAKTRISVFGEDTDAEYGDTITVKARLSSFDGTDYATKAYYLSKGIFLKGFALSGISVEKAASIPIIRRIYDYREALLSRINIMLNGDTGALVSAMFLGERSCLSAEQKQDINSSGLSHMTAVSGLHLSVIMTLVMAAFDAFLPNRRAFRFIVLVTTVIAFMVLFKFTPSVMRASFMMMVYHSAPLFFRRTEPLNSVGIALFVITAISPFAAYDCGLMLSVSGTIGAGWLGGKVNRRLRYRNENILKTRRNLRERIRAITRHGTFYPEQPFKEERLTDITEHRSPLRDTVVSSACALLCVIPISAVYFGGASIWSVLSGLIIQPFFTVCLGTMVLFTFTGGISGLFLLIAGICANVMNEIIGFFGRLEFGFIDLSYEFIPPLLFLGAVYVVVSFIRVRDRRARLFSVCFMCLAFASSVGVAAVYSSEIAVMDVISDGDGGAAVVQNGGRYTVIVADDGRKTAEKIYTLLKNKSVRTLECLDLTRLDGGICDYSAIFSGFNIKAVLISEDAAIENRQYKFFQDATIVSKNDTVIMTDNALTIKGGITYMNLRGTTVSVSEINEGNFRGGIAVMDGVAEELEIIGSINVYIDKKQKDLNAQSVNAYETDVRFYFKDKGLVAEDYG